MWQQPELRERELGRMRKHNPEWDFMGRSFFVWSLANMGLREPAAVSQYLPVMDQIIEETLELERRGGCFCFLMAYGRASPFRVSPVRSLFVDGEIALMLGARRVLAEKPEYRAAMHERLEMIAGRWRSSPVLAMESYPDECWTFDHAVALAALCVADSLDGTDHSALRREWLRVAQERLIDRGTGLLVSSYTLDGQPMDGPEGSTIWAVAHFLDTVDPEFARDQYVRARREMGRTLLGFGYAREWPASWESPNDVDSGAVIPVLEVSAGASGMAFLGATTFGDEEFARALATTLDFAAFPSRKDGGLRYCGSNAVGDAAILYAAVLGPLWEKVRPGGAR